jgi:hypothetical protein
MFEAILSADNWCVCVCVCVWRGVAAVWVSTLFLEIGLKWCSNSSLTFVKFWNHPNTFLDLTEKKTSDTAD